MNKYIIILVAAIFIGLSSCNSGTENTAVTDNAAQPTATTGGQEAVQDNESAKDVVKIAIGSKDHTTLVAALKQAELVSSLSNAGPFTVFAPTNEAFDKLPAGTVDGLMKADKKADLQDILQYHVTLSSIKAENLRDGQSLGMVNGGNVAISNKDGKVILNGTANIIASIPAANGIVHVIDAVLLPAKK